LHVIDASDPRRTEHIEEVDRVLDVIGAGDIPQIRVFNKIDRLEIPPRTDTGEDGQPAAVWISARGSAGLDQLLHAVAERLSVGVHRGRLRLPLSAGATRARLYAAGVVLGEHSDEEAFDLTVDLPEGELASLSRMPGTAWLPAS
jgi:GTPase